MLSLKEQRMSRMTKTPEISDAVLDELLKDYEKPEDLLGVSESGYYAGKVARRAGDTVKTWCCSRISATLLPYRMELMEARA